ncbi:hypothetical protein PGT21_015595 [Puccinia graminis f. sp. tritici]|uniref:Uncharacterized protein n=2 Tax=Puccinia graminis f. sp. tritici TaxID=56615 RepID=E3L984_PUCGT|nr:uncharacterized protein PGTG_19214 [Puccinia graminis f. sp. tritici CRL 75-36-700-3]EFP93109.1 hypothetical protein PGTG_19214 [Puccinia graminis f. sp. tritici CRL 75-36-700-3]KAA1074681.1 hypothetical protein PGT21_015595 [Puccinia graminis f. sp. tritici]
MSKTDSVSETITQTTRFLLTSSNYTIWILPMAAKLEDIRIWTYVTGVLKNNEKTPDEELAQLSIVKRLESYSVTNKIKKESKKESSINPPMMLHTCASSQPIEPTPSVSPICVHCKKTGHRPTKCWTKYPEKAPKTPTSHYTHYVHASG